MSRLHIMLTRCLTAACLADIEFTPHKLDIEKVRKEHNRVCTRLLELDLALSASAQGANLSSPKQLGELLYDKLGFHTENKTASGARSTNIDTIKSLEAKTKEQKEFLALYLEYNKLQSYKEKNLDFFMIACEQYGGEFYGEFHHCRTVNHRLASSGKKIGEGKATKSAQLQNLPRACKELFTAPPGHLVGETDGSQIEFRAAGDLTRDLVAISDIVNKVDVHTNTALAFEKAGDRLGKDAKEARQNAKPATFKPMYGGYGRTHSEKAYRTFFTTRYATLAGSQEKWCYDVLAAPDKGLRTAYGMIYYFPSCSLNSWGRVSDSTAIYNYPISGFATAEIIPITLVLFWHRTDGLPIQIVSTVHDSIKSWVREDFVEQYTQISKECFTRDVDYYLRRVYNYTFITPLGCGIKVGTHWGTGEERKFDWLPDKREWVEL
jgi:DNA polymerase-1